MSEVERITKALEEAVQVSCSDMAFLDVVMKEGLLEKPVHQVFSLVFYEPIQGSLMMYMPLDFKKSVVENIMADDWDQVPADERDDCLLEFLNVLAGNFLERYLGPEIPYRMSLPQVLFQSEEPDDMEERFLFDAEGMEFQVGSIIRTSEVDGTVFY